MPFVRIDASQALEDDDLAAISRAVQGSLATAFNVPEDDLFQVIVRHPPGGMVIAREFLGVQHTDAPLFIQIDCSPGRTVEMKQQLYAGIVREVSRTTSVPANDVIIHLVETVRENWSFGNGVAQYVK